MQAGLHLCCSQILEDRFSGDEAKLKSVKLWHNLKSDVYKLQPELTELIPLACQYFRF